MNIITRVLSLSLFQKISWDVSSIGPWCVKLFWVSPQVIIYDAPRCIFEVWKGRNRDSTERFSVGDACIGIMW